MPERSVAITLENVGKRFGKAAAVRDVSLAILEGEFFSLLGPSGCGKTTTLRMIAGFEVPDEGRILLKDQDATSVSPNRRPVNMVFQQYALFPHMSIYDNVAFGLKVKRVPRSEHKERIDDILRVVALQGMERRRPRQLSGGQQQRVALARALAVEPRILLLDEPFGALDKNLRLDMQIEVKRLQRQFGITAILVTHDQEEAMSLADRIAVMNRGRVEQFASPVEVYDRPRTLFVNSFVGTANVLAGEITARDGAAVTVVLDAGATITAPGGTDGKRVIVSARPENLRLYTEPAAGRWAVELRIRMPVGAQMVSEVVTRAGQSLKVIEPRATLAATGDASGALYCGIVSATDVSLFANPNP